MSYLLCYAGFRYGTDPHFEEEREQFAPNELQLMGIEPGGTFGFPSVSGEFKSPVPDVKIEEFETFKEAVAQYTYRCLQFREVTLSAIHDSTGEGEIIRQYSRDGGFIR